MLEIYYRIWVSLFIKARFAQKGDINLSLFFSLMALTVTNFINVLLVLTILSLSGIKINIFQVLPENGIIQITTICLAFLIPNYLLLIHNKKYQVLLNRYENINDKNMGMRYFLLSNIAFLILIILTIIFPDFFGLTKN
ncbi:MAG: hypothetical protein CFE23_16365 [Flavobacterium sp. BFFFF1]|nr:MAG: hypothetical protein CFE23_16365 [Flavobacterium sp. BFFFF1]